MKWVFALMSAILLCACMSQGPSLMLTDITFCADEPGDRSYQQKQDATYHYGEIVWMYTECFNFDYSEKEDGYAVYFVTTLEVYNAKGEFVNKVDQPMEIPSKTKPVYVWLTFWIDSLDLEKGTYTVRIRVEDRLSGESIMSEGTFTVIE